MTAKKDRLLRRLLPSILVMAASAGLMAQPTTAPSPGKSTPTSTLVIGGKLPAPFELDAAAFAALPRQEARVKDHGGQDAVYGGVSLRELLLRAKAPLGGHQMRGPNVALYVLAEAADGYRVVYALAECDAEVAERNILVADQRDGKPLDAKEGPYRIIVPGEKLQARWIRQVKSITVKSAE